MHPDSLEIALAEEHVQKLQEYLWRKILGSNWSPVDSHWSHDDNTESQRLGWAIFTVQREGLQIRDLFSLNHIPSPVMFQHIVKMANVDPMCAKAVALLTTQRLSHPHIKFQFLGGGHV